MTRFLFLSLFIVYLGCVDKTKKNRSIDKDKEKITIKTNTQEGIHEIRLGKSNYFIQLPDNFKLSEVRGKEGGLGFDIMPNNASSSMFGFIGILQFHPIGEFLPPDTAKIFAISNLLDKKVKWKIYKTENGFFNAFTSEQGDLNANAIANKRNEIDSLVSIISTLKLK